jgi:hypothetical protein
MGDVRATFLDTGRLAADLLARPEVAARWDEPSALAEFSVRGLAGHLVRAAGSTEAYLDRDEPSDADVIDAPAYYRAAVGDDASVDLGAGLHVAIRQRGEDAAAAGPAALHADMVGLLDRLTLRLAAEPPTRRMRVYQDLVLLLDDYLVTRLIELAVHLDDLAVSVGLDPPVLSAGAGDLAIRTLVDVARLRQGDVAVLRALTRRERTSAAHPVFPVL